jgi:hypothetical protein
MWRPICSGLNLPEKETVQAQFTLGSQYNSGNGLKGTGLTFWNLRGWRKYRKGSIQPYQLSPEELRAAGFEFWPHVYSSQVTIYFAPGLIPGAQGGGAASQEQLFNCPAAVAKTTELDAASPHAQQGDFLVQRIAVRPTAPVAPASATDLLPFMTTILVGILPKGGVVAALQGGTNMPPTSYQGGSALGLPTTISMVPWGSMMSVDYSGYISSLLNPIAPPLNPVPRLETIWDLVERPLLVKNNTRWNLQAQGAFALGSTNNSGSMVLEFSFHGVLLTRSDSARRAEERHQEGWLEREQLKAQRRREARQRR